MSGRVTFATIASTVVLAVMTNHVTALEPQVIDLWPGRAPGETVDPANDTVIPIRPEEDPPTLRLTNVTRPQITFYQPSAENNTGVAILVCPGGGFNHLAYDKEGTEVAQWLTRLGITGVVLKYRCPTKQNPQMQHVKPLQDAQRAIAILRSRADEWAIDPEKIGICGFSAGGKVAALAAANWGLYSVEAADDPTNGISTRPSFAILIYPAMRVRSASELTEAGIRVTSETPPTFIAYSWDDRHPSPGALHLALALKEAGVSCELHQYASGGHGYGMRSSDQPASSWPARLEDWLHSTAILTK